MDNKLLLVHGITLLYRESQLENLQENSSALVRDIVLGIKLPEINIGMDSNSAILDGLRKTAMEMCETPIGHVYEQHALLQRLRMNVNDEEGLYEALYNGISTQLTNEATIQTCLNIKRSLTNFIKEQKIQEIISKAYLDLKFNRTSISDIRKFISEVASKLEPFRANTEVKDPAVISDINVTNLNEVVNVFDAVNHISNGTAILKTGWQALNRMYDGGIRRGEEHVIGALQHNYKTGFSLTLFKQIAIHNIPQLTDPNKKPLLLRISFEDSIDLNFEFLYCNLKENETGEVPDVSNTSASAMAEYVQAKLSVNGYHTRLMHVNPSMWSYVDICNKVIELESEGYEVHMVMVDYLLKLPTTGCDQGPSGHDIRNMYERLRNFMTSKNIAFITPHQLSTDAKMMIRNNQQDFVTQLPGKGFYAGSKQIDQVVDVETFIHIETVNGSSYLTIQRGKHRKNKQTPIEYHYTILPFTKLGGIMDDINKRDSSRKRLGGGEVGSPDEIPFWEQ